MASSAPPVDSAPEDVARLAHLIVTVPALDEERTVGAVIQGVPRNIPGVGLVEVVVVDDGSRDATAERAAEAGRARRAKRVSARVRAAKDARRAGAQGAARTSMMAAFEVPSGSRGEFHAIVAQFMTMTKRMNMSNGGHSTKRMHSRRGVSAGRRKKSERPW